MAFHSAQGPQFGLPIGSLCRLIWRVWRPGLKGGEAAGRPRA